MHLHIVRHVVEWMHFIQGIGPPGWFLFVGIYALCCLLFLPASVLTVAAGAVYGFWAGCVLVLAGNGLGSLLSLLITRFLLRGWAAHRFEKYPKLKAIEKAVAKDDWKLVFLTRLSPFMPFSLINYTLGLTKISPWRFLWATELGAVPATVLYVYIGTMIGNLARIGPELKQHRPIEWVFQGVGLLLVVGVSIYVTHVVNRALKGELHA